MKLNILKIVKDVLQITKFSRIYIIFCICLLSLNSNLCQSVKASTSNLTIEQLKTNRIYLSGKGCDDMVTWDFFCTQGMNSGHWDKIGVPSCWEQQGFGYYNYGKDVKKHDEIGLYRRKFKADKSWKDKLVQIVFEGSMTDTEVKINGHIAGDIHQGAFYCFKRDITKYLKYDEENLLEVKVSKMSSNYTVSMAERQADYWVFGGIFRPVYLEVSPKIRISSTAFDAKCDGSLNANIFINKKIKNASVIIEIRDSKNKLKGTCFSDVKKSKVNIINIKGKFKDIKPWSTEYPNLYNATIYLKEKGKAIYKMNQTLGFRTIEVRPKDGIYLNGKKIKMKGINRHCAWPESGRTTSKALSIKDAMLMKDMNINAVRMSHYSPDKHFLDVCDSLGLMVLDELTSWSKPAYDTKVGTILLNEMLKFDVNHPCIVFWDNGNEGGVNYDLDPLFSAYDLQKRKVLHPWGWSSDLTINTLHYIAYNHGIKNMFQARDIFMPTECLHGLYDGGLGAGLNDFWKLMNDMPNSAGLFMWAFADEGIVRTDKGGLIDANTYWAADGLVGPYREKEGSYYTVRNIWSPVQIKSFNITSKWNQDCLIKNDYFFTDLNTCHIKYSLLSVKSLNEPLEIIGKGKIKFPSIKPDEVKHLNLNIPDIWKKADILKLEVYDYNDKEIGTWTYDIKQPERVAEKLIPINKEINENPVFKLIKGLKEGDNFVWSTEKLTIKISSLNGLLKEVISDGKKIPLNNGPIILETEKPLTKPEVKIGDKGRSFSIIYKKNDILLYSFTWTLNEKNILKLDYNYRRPGSVNFSGITFNYPEKTVTGCKLLARGPYRVYKNRLKGVNLGLWNKKYNDTRTGLSWDYPEFKGYYSNFYGIKILSETPFEIYSGSVDMYLHLFTPSSFKLPSRYPGPYGNYPKGDLSFLDAIAPIGTKFKHSEDLGPEGKKAFARNRWDTPPIHNVLYFKF